MLSPNLLVLRLGLGLCCLPSALLLGLSPVPVSINEEIEECLISLVSLLCRGFLRRRIA